MANVDLCTRYAEEGLCFKTEENAEKIANLPIEIQNIIFRNKTALEITQMLNRFSNTIRATISEKYDFECVDLFPSSNDNRDGADLFCIHPETKEKITIEVKFGSYTDKAVGMVNFAKIFGTDIFSVALSIQARRMWSNLVGKEYANLAPQLTRLSETLNAAAESFNQTMSEKNYTLSPSEQAYMEDYLINNSGSYESKTENYLRFGTSPDGKKILLATPIQKGAGEWRVEPIEPLDFTTNPKARINVFLTNSETKTSIKFVLNNKNNFKLTPTIKIPSKYMLNSPSWNVWIKSLD